MTKVNFAANREKAEEAGLIKGGGVFNKTLKNGDNQFRLVSGCLAHPGTTMPADFQIDGPGARPS